MFRRNSLLVLARCTAHTRSVCRFEALSPDSRVQGSSFPSARLGRWTGWARRVLVAASFLLACPSAPWAAAPAVAAGFDHSVALKNDGTVWGWGNNLFGQLGDGTPIPGFKPPVSVTGLSGVVAIAAGYSYTVALKGDGTVWSWGYNVAGQLGDGTTTNRPTPAQVGGLNGVVAIAAGGYRTVALKADGTVWAWGSNSNGQVGDGTTTTRLAPVKLSGLNDVVVIAAGFDHTVAVKADGTVWAWGDNSSGQLGDGTTARKLVPVEVTGLSGASTIAAGGQRTVVLKGDGTVWAWGYDPGVGVIRSSASPVRVAGLSGVSEVPAGIFHSVALKGDGSAWAWGTNVNGQLGDGTITTRLTPVEVQGLSGVTTIAAGTSHTVALKSDGTVWGWGLNVSGQLGDSTTTDRRTPVQVLGPGGEGLLNLGPAVPRSVRINPEQPVYGPALPSGPAAADKSKNLVVLIHGWNSNPESWAEVMKASIVQRLKPGYSQDACMYPIETDAATWRVCWFDWRIAACDSDSAWKPLGNYAPRVAYVNAIDVGRQLATNATDGLFKGNYDFVHFIAHSAGSQVADTAATWLKAEVDKHNTNATDPFDRLKKPLIHTTFLDAYDPLGERSQYGRSSDWAEQYVDARPVGLFLPDGDHTRITLPNAYNFDITSLDPAASDVLGSNAHAWPYEWYQFTADNPGVFNYGFSRSVESGQTQPPGDENTRRGKLCTFPTILDKTCSDNTESRRAEVRVLCADLLSCYSSDPTKVATSETGTVTIRSSSLSLINGSPAWAGWPMEITEPADVLSFDYAFSREAEGLLTVFFDGQLVFKADQRIAKPGVNRSPDVPIGTIGAGTHSVTFRLDAFNGTQSEVDISQIKLGKTEITVVTNQPPIANAGTDQTVRLNSLVTLNGNGSSDPDGGPQPLTYAWRSVSAPNGSVALTNPTSSAPTFSPGIPGTYTFGLVVSDGLATSPEAEVSIVVTKLGDFDGNGVVNFGDLAALRANFGGTNPLYDLNGDGVVNFGDLAIFRSVFGR